MNVIAEKDRDRHSLNYNAKHVCLFYLVVKLCSPDKISETPITHTAAMEREISPYRILPSDIVSVISDKSMGEMNPITAIDSLFLPQ